MAQLALPVYQHRHSLAVAPRQLRVAIHVHDPQLETKAALHLLQGRDHLVTQMAVVAAIDGQHRAYNTVKRACVAARIGDDAKRRAANMSILASRATKCPAQGGAGSKRLVLGCDPGAGRGSAGCAVLTPACTVASRKRVPAPRSGASPILAATPWETSAYR